MLKTLHSLSIIVRKKSVFINLAYPALPCSLSLSCTQPSTLTHFCATVMLRANIFNPPISAQHQSRSCPHSLALSSSLEILQLILALAVRRMHCLMLLNI